MIPTRVPASAVSQNSQIIDKLKVQTEQKTIVFLNISHPDGFGEHLMCTLTGMNEAQKDSISM